MERLIAWYRVGSSVGAIVALIVANAVPLLGVLFLGWSVWTILTVYWLENGIVGVFNVLRILHAEGTDDRGAAGWRYNGRSAVGMSRAAIVPMFVMNYGIFWVVHGIFVLTLPTIIGVAEDGSIPTPTIDLWTVALALILLTVSHGASYEMNFIRGGEYRRVSPAVQMAAPYGRLIVLHMTIILGALVASFMGSPVGALVILVVLKTALDLGFHLNEHRRVVRAPGETPGDAPSVRPGRV